MGTPFGSSFGALGPPWTSFGSPGLENAGPFGGSVLASFFVNLRSDSGGLGTAKTSIIRERGCKNQTLVEVGFLRFGGSLLETF